MIFGFIVVVVCLLPLFVRLSPRYNYW